MSTAAFVYAPVLTQYVLRQDHPLVPRRLRLVYELLEAYGVFQHPHARLVPPRMATPEELLWFHTPDYVEAVQSLSGGETRINPLRYNFSQEGDNPVFPGMFEASAWAVGASLVAADLVAQGSVGAAVNFAGGLHHAMPNYASGFCIFNDVVIAIQSLLRRGLKVAYIDIDAHHGDGVQFAFYDTDQVLTISLHESGEYLFPGTGFVHEIGVGKGRGYAVNVPLAPYTDDETYLWAFREVVPPLINAFCPDVLATQLGIDTHRDTPITHMKMTVQGFIAVVRDLQALARGRWLAFGGGGYDLSAVARGWAWAYAVMVGMDLPDTIPASFQERYGIRRLQDDPQPLDETQRRLVRRYAEASVAEVKRLVFPLHGLSALA
ncbi:MAG: acetoin utilization protein AcuC [Dehalococcoidia bacterium]|nr:acetoin utilization protein AcuC [Dehalococcoidia bacterium]MDW8120326.1 acetoin utilization protein AcuC [Chloroflexota bacterium]